MPVKHISTEQYSGSVSKILRNLSVHPDIVDRPTNVENYLMPIIFTVEKGEPITATHVGPAIVYVTEGELQFEDTSNHPGNTTVISAGDVVHIEQGTIVVWNSSSIGKGFAVIYGPASVKGPEDFVA